MLKTDLALSAAPVLDQVSDRTPSGICDRCGELEDYFVHRPSAECAGGYPCINPGAHHTFTSTWTEAEARQLWGDR